MLLQGQSLQSALQILRSNEEWFCVFFARVNQANRRPRRKNREELLFRARRVKLESTIQFKHTVRILR